MSQGAIQLPTQGPVSPTTFSGDINTAFGAIATKNSGGSAPSNFSTGTGVLATFQDWVNTGTATNSPWQVYDGTNWIVVGTLDTSNHVWKTYWAAGAAVTQQSYAANQNNLNPFSTLAENRVPVTVTSSTGVQITGITSTVVGMGDGRIVTIEAADTSETFQLLASSGASSAGNKLDMPVNLYVAPGNTVSFYYSSTAANWRHLCGGTRAPTQQKFTSGTAATYTTPTGCSRIRGRLVGGGGSGAQSSTGGANGVAGNASSFGSVSCNGGVAGTSTGGGGALSGNGAGSTGTWTNRFQGSAGDAGSALAGGGTGGNGGNSFFDGGGAPGGAAAANSGSGGGGMNSPGAIPGGGGGAGEYAEFDIPGPSTSYTYTVGAVASAPAGAGNGSAGAIYIEEWYS